MSAFAQAMAASSTTWNGAVSLSTPDVTNTYSGRLGLFFKGVRGLPVPTLFNFLEESSKESLVDTFVLAFHLRDCRGGKGERSLGRNAMKWLLVNFPEEFGKVVQYLPEYGRWDDMLSLFPGVLDLTDLDQVRKEFSCNVKSLYMPVEVQKKVVKLFCDKIREDAHRMSKGESCSLAAKWAPTENDSIDRQFKTVSTICEYMQITPRQYRKLYISPLRSYLNIVETYMCSKRWNEIEFSKVPSCAIKRLKKAFEKNCPETFQEWVDGLASGKTTVKAKQLYPHELVAEVDKKRSEDTVAEQQWKILEADAKKLGALKDAIPLVDTSGSMTGLPMNVAMAVGLIVANTVEGPFHNHLINFHTTPKFTVLPDGLSLFSRVTKLLNMGWGGSTNLQAVFDLILNRALECELDEADMPKKLIIISDMQFNQTESGRSTNLEDVNKKYASHGYKRPDIVFWNVNGSTTDFPASTKDTGTALISGFSTSILKSVMEGKEISPVGVMRDTLYSERYSVLRQNM